MNRKVMAIVKSDKGKYLLLKTNPKWLKVNIWFVVTGSVEGKETEEAAARREVIEETGLKIIDIKKTSYFCEYEWPKGSGKMHHEHAFLVTVKEEAPKLSGEHLDFRWLSKSDFLSQIAWQDNIKMLREII